jgi:hypothetical protein
MTLLVALDRQDDDDDDDAAWTAEQVVSTFCRGRNTDANR